MYVSYCKVATKLGLHAENFQPWGAEVFDRGILVISLRPLTSAANCTWFAIAQCAVVRFSAQVTSYTLIHHHGISFVGERRDSTISC